ncbi:MAG: hypothetical protein WC464_04705 [Bdellovibrionales bacterium]
MMPTDFADSRDFYQSPIGRRTLDVLRARVREMAPAFADERVLPLGSASLLLDSPSFVSGRLTSERDENFSCLVDSKNKLLPDGDIDRIVVLHAVAEAEDMTLLLREAWRVLKGEGRLLLIVPRLGSAWAQNPDTPFGKEKAYSAAQIKKALTRQGFFVARLKRALYAPPDCSDTFFSLSQKMESALPCPFGGGVFLIAARKRILGLAGAKKVKARAASDPFLPSPLPI